MVDYRKIHPDAHGHTPHYLVYRDDLWCGSIYRWPGTAEVQWHWIVNGCVFVQQQDQSTGVMHFSEHGSEDTREEAMKAWRAAWHRLNPDLDAMRVDQNNFKSRVRRPVDQYAEYQRVVKRDREAFLARMAETVMR
ncbi:hypothetical protein DY251_08900 [Mesorhizobium denitrificans]|uniref:Uncharacterized protein n=1 Tax=Mesorhizobium denitrificans TaxID=2294114 RepID=A0A371XEP9_9HYPH|nr:hypothetical protein DY251_08900 [Mesorhizobium denitrificans]